MKIISPLFFFILIGVVSTALKVAFLYSNSATLSEYYMTGISLTLERFLQFASIPLILLVIAAVSFVFVRSFRLRVASMLIACALTAFSLFLVIALRSLDGRIIDSFSHIFTDPYRLEDGAKFEHEMFCCGWDDQQEPVAIPCEYELTCRDRVSEVYEDVIRRNFLLSVFALLLDIAFAFFAYQLIKELEIFELAEWERLTELVKYKYEEKENMYQI